MPSRRKRKRDRRRRQSGATAQAPNRRGVWGADAPPSATDCGLIRRAIRDRWPTPLPVRQAVMQGIDAGLADPASGPRHVIALARVVLDADAANGC